MRQTPIRHPTGTALPDLTLEFELWRHYGGTEADYAIAFDEAGRGPLFGPVTLGAFLITQSTLAQLPELAAGWRLTDSKKMSSERRSRAFADLNQMQLVSARHIALRYIERYNINRAIEYGILRLTKTLWQRRQRPPLFLLMDGNYKFGFDLPFHTRIKGDSRCLSIAAASVAAKVSRDNLIEKSAERYAQYEIASHKGYGTARHLEAIRRLGPSRHHRKSFLKNIIPE